MPENEGARVLGQAMSGTITDALGIANRRIAKFQALPPIHRERKRASYGIGLLTGGVYIFHTLQVHRYASIDDMYHFYIRGLQERPEFAAPYYGWTFMMVLGIAWTVVGLRGSRGPRSFMAAFWAVAFIAFFSAMLEFEWYPEDIQWLKWVLRGIYFMALSSFVTELYLSLRGSGQGAARAVADWIDAHRKRFRLGRKSTV